MDKLLQNKADRLLREGFETLLASGGEWREIVTLFKPGAKLAPSAPQPDSGRIYSASVTPPVIPAFPVSENFTRKVKVIWSTDALKMMPMKGQDGIYYEGDVLLTVRVKDLDSVPKPGLILQSPVGMSYRILDVVEDFGVYEIKLVRN
jgi:hypothetical protein